MTCFANLFSSFIFIVILGGEACSEYLTFVFIFVAEEKR